MRRAAIRAAAGCAAPALPLQGPHRAAPPVRLPHAAARRTAAAQAAATAAEEALELIQVLRDRNVDIAGLTTVDKLREKVQATAASAAVGEPRDGEEIGPGDLDPGDRVWVSTELITDSYDEVLLPVGTKGIVLDVERQRKKKGRKQEVDVKIDFEGVEILQWLFEDKIPLMRREEPKEDGEKREFGSSKLDRKEPDLSDGDNEDDEFWDNDNGEGDGEATRSLTLSVGQRVHAKRFLLTDNLEREAIEADTPGVVLGLDSWNDVQIDFDGVEKLQWMAAGRFDRDLRLLRKKWDQGKKGARKRERRVFASQEEREAFFESLPPPVPKLTSGRLVTGTIEVPRTTMQLDGKKPLSLADTTTNNK